VKTPALQYIRLARRRLNAIAKDLPAITSMGQDMAGRLLKGGALFAPKVAKYWPSEFCGRAGGLMGARQMYVGQSRQDVGLLALGDPRRADARAAEELQKLVDGKATLFVVGRKEDLPSFAPAGRFAGFTGDVDPGEGLFGHGEVRPLATLRPFEQLVRGWTTTGEFITACMRGGKMPVIWMSVWHEGAPARNTSLMLFGNLGEPRPMVPLFHEDRFIPPLPAGYAAGEFLRELDGIITVLEKQADVLAKAGAWMAEASTGGHKVHAVAAGHSYPAILELPPGDGYPVEWGPASSEIPSAVPERLGAGDVAIHFGYGPVNVDHARAVLARGVRFIHSSPYGRPAQLRDHRNLLWLDLPWRPADATVDVPGYGVRILPTSSSADTVAYFAMLCEMAQAMGWK